MLLTCFAILVGSPCLLALLMFLVPGRKGKMRTERDVAHDGLSVEQARSLYAARLAYDGFAVEESFDPAFLRAVRSGAPSGQSHAHADKGMTVEMRFTPMGGGVRVQVAAWVKDFVFYDTGEGRMVDLTLDRLLHAELTRDAVPVVPTPSYSALSSVVVALLGITIIALAMFATRSRDVRTASIVAGAALACGGSLLVALEAARQIRARPAEVSGSQFLVAAAVLGVLGMLAGALALYLRFRETLIQAFRQELP
jgi:hypothetical protein